MTLLTAWVQVIPKLGTEGCVEVARVKSLATVFQAEGRACSMTEAGRRVEVVMGIVACLFRLFYFLREM